MRLDKCDVYTANEILGYRGKNICFICKKGSKEIGKSERDKKRNKSTNK